MCNNKSQRLSIICLWTMFWTCVLPILWLNILRVYLRNCTISNSKEIIIVQRIVLPVRLSSEIRKLPPDPPVRGFPGVWKLPLLRLPSRDGSPSLTLLSLFLSFIFCPTSFWRQWAAFLGVWCPLLAIRSCFAEFAQRSNDLSINLWGRKWSPRPIPLPS